MVILFVFVYSYVGLPQGGFNWGQAQALQNDSLACLISGHLKKKGEKGKLIDLHSSSWILEDYNQINLKELDRGKKKNSLANKYY